MERFVKSLSEDGVVAVGDHNDPLSETFSFWVPVEKSLAAADTNAEALRFVQGLASKASWDQQDERVLQEGIDFQPLKRYGYINWNHEKGPQNLIGEPLEVDLRETRKGFGLWSRGFLYKGMERADHAWELLEQIEKAREAGYGSRQMGWSVEGGILQRDPFNNKIIRKSIVRHLALTHEPVHADTYAEIAKSNSKIPQMWVGDEVEFRPDRNRHLAFDSFEQFAKAVGTGPGVGGAGAMGDMSPVMNRSWMGAIVDSTQCKGKCRRFGYRPRAKSMAHLVECCGADLREAHDFVKSLVLALD